MIQKVNLEQKFSLFQEQWSPKIIAELNDAYVKIVKLAGEFVWHKHQNEDELFLVIKGNLTIHLLDSDILLREGELVVIQRGVEHCPEADSEAQVLLLEPKSTVNTGDASSDRTRVSEWI